VSYRLLEAFRGLFEGRRYQHRASSQGDWVSYHLYEDLHAVGKSRLLIDRIESREHVLCVANKRQGIRARRGDGTFGELVPGVAPVIVSGFIVARGPVANVEIGAEAKILAKAMIKQIDRVISDLKGQVTQFKRGGGTPICVGIVGINRAESYTSYEGKVTCPRCGQEFDLERPTDGRRYAHPAQEAAAAERRLTEAEDSFDEFLVLRYRATNREPYPFEWVNYEQTFRDYGAILTRISRAYDAQFAGPARRKQPRRSKKPSESRRPLKPKSLAAEGEAPYQPRSN
jgi:hypothetical protein